jgi:serine/threonine protein kinase
MATPDATAIAQLALRLHLVTDEQLRDCWEELSPGAHDAHALLRVLERKGYLTSWQSSKLMKEERDGFFLGGYRILYKIASGSFGRVFRADDPSTGNNVAIKVLRRRWSEDPHKIDLFVREGKVGLTMQHPNIVRILAVSKDNVTGQHFIVMEFVEGGNLRDFLAIRKKLEAREALKFLEECSNGLAYAFFRGLTHRDLKLTNILISSQGTAKLVDFGLAEIALPKPGEDHDTAVDRTVDYAGLEKATAVKHGDVRSDVYFMGCVFYEMLTGRAPLSQTRDRVARMHRHRFDNVPPIEPGEVTAPPSVFRLLDKMIAFDPSVRFQTPAQLHEAVRRVYHEVEGGKDDVSVPAGPKTIFIVEKNEKVRDALRAKFKELGFRVLITHNPAMACQRYKEQPYHAVVMDAVTAGEEGIESFKAILNESDDLGLTCAALLIIDADQSDWAAKVPQHKAAAVLTRPVTLKQLCTKIAELTGETPTAPAASPG